MKINTIIVGGGPAGLACAIAAKEKGVDYLVLEKGALVNSVYNFPADMEFFSTPDLLSIGSSMFVSSSFRPSRIEGLNYYRAVADHYDLKVSTYEKVETIEKNSDGSFAVRSVKRHGEEIVYTADRVIVASGYYDNPNMLGIDGEDLPHVAHYYTEAHPFHRRDVVIVGAKNSAVEAALNFHRTGANVTLVHRGEGISSSVKYWVRPDIDKKIESGDIGTRFNCVVEKIDRDNVSIRNLSNDTAEKIAADFVFLLTGYHPDTKLLASAGVNMDEKMVPEHDPKTLETNVKGLYIAGSVAAGLDGNKIFIENSREHAPLIFGRD